MDCRSWVALNRPTTKTKRPPAPARPRKTCRVLKGDVTASNKKMAGNIEYTCSNMCDVRSAADEAQMNPTFIQKWDNLIDEACSMWNKKMHMIPKVQMTLYAQAPNRKRPYGKQMG